jgi:hypothetical protein
MGRISADNATARHTLHNIPPWVIAGPFTDWIAVQEAAMQAGTEPGSLAVTVWT